MRGDTVRKDSQRGQHAPCPNMSMWPCYECITFGFEGDKAADIPASLASMAAETENNTTMAKMICCLRLQAMVID